MCGTILEHLVDHLHASGSGDPRQVDMVPRLADLQAQFKRLQGTRLSDDVAQWLQFSRRAEADVLNLKVRSQFFGSQLYGVRSLRHV